MSKTEQRAGTWQRWVAERNRVRQRRQVHRTDAIVDPSLVDLASNDYLGLSNHPRLREAVRSWAEKGPVGAGASRVVTGTSEAHHHAEQQLCALTGAQAAVTFSSGYLANLGALSAVGGPRTAFFLDDHVHASLHDAAKIASSAQVSTFAHQDLDCLEGLLQAAWQRQLRAAVVVESVYSVLGDSTDLAAAAELCRRYEALLVVDEAHSLGTLGAGSALGQAQLLDIVSSESPPILMTASLSKSLGGQGGVVLIAGADAPSWRAHVINTARSFIFDTGLSPIVAAAAAEAARLIRTEKPHRGLEAAMGTADRVLTRNPILAQHVEPIASPIVSVRMPDAASAAAAASQLRDLGILVGCFRPPSVPDGVSRLRITLKSYLPPQQLTRVLGQVAAVAAKAWGAPSACPFAEDDARPAEKKPDQVLLQDPETIRAVLGDPPRFSASNALTAVQPLTGQVRRYLAREGLQLPAVLASADGPRHREVRKLVAPFFSPGRVKQIKPRMQEVAADLAEQCAQDADHGSVDLADSLAGKLPPLIMAELTGLPLPEFNQLKRWSQDSLELFWGWPDAQRQRRLAESAVEFHHWLREQVRETDDPETLFGALKTHGITEAKIISFGYFLTIAGQETTSMLISTALYRLFGDPGLLESCGNTDTGEAASRSVVQKSLAHQSSVPTWRRKAEYSTVLPSAAGDIEVAAGDDVLLQLSGIHHSDPSLAFGYGVHRCLGAGLAEEEATVAVHTAAQAMPHSCLTGAEPVWTSLLSFQAPEQVLVTSGDDCTDSRERHQI